MARGVIFPGFCSDTTLPLQSFAEPPAPMPFDTYVDFTADTLRLGDPGPVWGDRSSSSRVMAFSQNRPVVMVEGGRQFVRLSDDAAGSSAGMGSVPNAGAITRYVRFRFPDGNPSGTIMGVYGSGYPNIYASGQSVAAHSGAQTLSTVRIDDGQWHNLIAVFTTTGCILSVDGTEITRTYTPAARETGLTLNYWNGSISVGRRLDIARAGQYQVALSPTGRASVLSALTANA